MNEELRTLNKMGSLQGTVPQTVDEIMVTSNYLKHVGMEQKTGQKIKLDIGDGVRREYSISGILPLEEAKRYFNIYTSHAYMDCFYKSNLTGTAYFRMKESDMNTTDAIRSSVYDLAKDLGVAKGSVVFSTYYFMLMEKSSSSQFLLVMAVNTIILLACALVIYSVFYIAITERVKDYGKLHIIGATRKQIKRIIKKEKRYFFSIAAPVGLLLGCIAGYFIIPKGFDAIMTINIAAVVLIVTYMAISLSMNKPMKIAADVSPVESVHIVTTVSRKPKKVHRRLTPYRLAWLYFCQDTRKTAATIISLGFSGVMLMGCMTYLFSVNPESMAGLYFPDGQFKITLSTKDETENELLQYQKLQQNNPLNEDFINRLLSIDGIAEIIVKKGGCVRLTIPTGDESIYLVNGITKEDSAALSESLLEGTCKYEEMIRKNGILVSSSDAFKDIIGWEVHIGDRIVVTGVDEQPHEFKVMGILNTMYSESRGYFFVSDQMLEIINPDVKNFNNQISVRADPQQLDNSEKLIRSEIENNKNLKLETFTDMALGFEKNLKNMRAPLFILVIIITFFALISLFNTIMANTLIRKREYAMLQAVGLTNKQLIKVMYTEGILYSLSFLIITLTIGTSVSLILCELFNRSYVYGKVIFRLPIGYLSVYFIIVILIQMGFSYFTINKYNKESLYEKMR